MTHKLPDRITTSACCKQIVQDGMKRFDTDIEWVRLDHHKAAVAAEREACAEVCFDYSKDHGTGAFDRHSAECERRIRACANTDALEAVRQETRNEALREAVRVCDRIRTQKASGPMPEGSCFDYEQAIEALITEDQSDE